MAEPATLDLQQVARRFGSRVAVAEFSLQVSPGSVHLIVGPNGSGKSTVARLAVGLLRPHGGQVRVFGNDPRGAPSARSRLGYLGHQTLLYGDLTPVENLAFSARLHGLDRLAERIEASLDSVGVGGERVVQVRRLSRGMTQRVAIARSLLHQPDLIVWDEPLTGLDQPSVTRVVDLLEQHRARGASVVVISHDLAELWRPNVAVHIVHQGRLQETMATSMPLPEFRARYAELAP